MFDRIKRLFKPKPVKSNKTVIAYIGPAGNTVVWSDDDYENFMNETYLSNVIAYQCINQIAKAVSIVPLKLMRGSISGDPVELFDPAYRKLFIRPNIYESWSFFIYKAICYYLGIGDTFIYRNMVSEFMGTPGRKIPKELMTLRPDRISIKTNNAGYPASYIYNDNISNPEYPIDTVTGECAILHLKTFHPIDQLYGMPVVKPATKEVDISNESAKWNMNLMLNEARPGMLVAVKGFLTDDSFKRLQKQLSEDYSGSSGAGRNVIIESEDGVTEVKPYSLTPKDIDFIEGGREVARRICMAYNYPPLLLGIPGDNTYSNYKEARLAFWEESGIYYTNFIINELSNWLFGYNTLTENLFFQPDYKAIPALKEQEDKLWERQEKAKDILTIDERRELVGYDPYGEEDMETRSPGSIILVSSSLIPLEFAVEEPTLPEEEPVPPDEEIDSEDDMGEDNVDNTTT